jgi:hypothetical protein
MKHTKITTILLATAMTVPAVAAAHDHDEEELEFEEAFLYFELNDTDGDLGLHGKVDGDGWKKVKIEGPDERKILQLKVKSGLKRQGMTELFFESSEPCFPDTCEDEDDVSLDPEVFFARFPEGVYEWEGKTLDNEEIEGEVYLSHRIPAAPVVASVGGSMDEPDPGECWGYTGVGDVTIDWDEVTKTHDSLGSDNDADLGDNSVLYYEFVAEFDGTDYKMTALVPPDTTEWTIPAEFIGLAEEYELTDEDDEPVEEVKFEIIVRVESGVGYDDDGEEVDSVPGNQSAVESCFLIVEDEDEEE